MKNMNKNYFKLCFNKVIWNKILQIFKYYLIVNSYAYATSLLILIISKRINYCVCISVRYF